MKSMVYAKVQNGKKECVSFGKKVCGDKCFSKSIVILLMLCMLVPLLTGCPQFSEKDAILDGNAKYCLSHSGLFGSSEKYAIVFSAIWDGDETNTTFEFKDVFQDRNVTQWGGGASGFQIETDSGYYYYDQGNNGPRIYKKVADGPDVDVAGIDDSVTQKTIVFTIKVGKYIKELHTSLQGYLIIPDGDSFIMYTTYYNVVCDEENTVFYAKDGKLYYRSNDTLVTKFDYAADHEV